MLLLSLFVLTARLVLAAYEELDINQAEDHFEKFMQDYNRVYSDYQEKQMRFNIFKEHLLEINEQNRLHGYNVLGINQFADMSKEEFSRTYLGLNLDIGGTPCGNNLKKKLPLKAPESFDWREKGIVTNVKDQKECGSCWAFSTIGNVESQYAKVHGSDKLINLSEQQLVDCDYGNAGCSGGNMAKAIMYLKKSGVMSEADYSYKGQESTCNYDQNKTKVVVTGCVNFTSTPEEELKDVLVNNGPITIALAGYPLQHYNGGVYKGCTGIDEINHALLLVGYGTDPDTHDPYWIIKNSWGQGYGEKGYIRIVRGMDECEIGSYLTFSAQVE